MQSRTTIHWDENERRSVAAEAFRISNREPEWTLRRVVSVAQKVLPENRRRPIDKTQDDKLGVWLMPLWQEMQERTKTAEELFKPPPVTPETVSVADMPAIAPQPVTTPVIEPKADSQPDSQPDARPSSSEATANDRKAMVYWKDEHKAKVIEKTFSLLRTFPDMSKLEAMRKAMQSELPPTLQRDLVTWGLVSAWAEPMLEKLEVDARILALEQKRAREAQEEAQRAEAARLEAERLIEQQAAQMRELQIEAAVTARVEKLSFEQLIHAFASKLARETISGIAAEFEKQMADKISNAVAQGVSTKETTPADDERMIVPPSSRVPLVGVVGLLNQQAEDVKKAFLGTIEFVFVKAQQEAGASGGGHAMLEKCARCDVVIAMTDHMGHDVTYASKKLHVPFKPLTGSVSNLKRFLHSWINGEVALKAA